MATAPSNKPTAGNTSSRRSSVRSEEMVILQQARRSKTPRPPSGSSSGSKWESGAPAFDTVTTAHYSIGYEGGEKQNTPRNIKKNSLRDSRQRIADAMGRR